MITGAGNLTGFIGVFKAKDEFAICLACDKICEKCGTDAADM